MKKIAIISAIALSGLLYNSANAQVRVHVGFNLGSPAVVYRQEPVVVEQPVYQETQNVYDDSNDDDYYYLPDVDAYYNVSAGCYYYNNGDSWISAAYLPGAYRDYDWRSARRFEIHEHRPFTRGDFYRSRFNGREVEAFRHADRGNRFGGGYAREEHYNRDAYRGYDRRSNNWGRDNRRPDTYRRNDDNNWNRGQGGYNQPSNRNNDRGGDNRSQGGGGQSSNQNYGGRNRDNRGGDDHFVSNSREESHRQARF